ncbi:elongation factor 2 [Tanacetum coccineum]
MKFSVSPVVRVAVNCDKLNTSKLLEGLKRLARSDAMVVCTTEEKGQHIIAVAGELQLEIYMKDLEEDFMDGALINKSSPCVSCCETVQNSRTVTSTFSRRGNNWNCLRMKASPMEKRLIDDIDEWLIGSRDDQFRLGDDLADKKLYFVPETTGPNMVVKKSKGDQCWVLDLLTIKYHEYTAE